MSSVPGVEKVQHRGRRPRRLFERKQMPIIDPRHTVVPQPLRRFEAVLPRLDQPMACEKTRVACRAAASAHTTFSLGLVIFFIGL
jgi:hypothetical protein